MSVGWAFLLCACWGAVFTLNGLRPLRRPGWAAGASFFAGWLTIELAGHHLAWQGLATWLWWQTGAFEETAGQVGLGVTAVSWAGLVWMLVQAGSTGRRIDEAVDEAAAAPTADASEVQAKPLPAPLWPRTIVAPLPIWRPDVVRDKGIVFARAGGLNLRLDVYRRRDRPEHRPIMVHVHGGAWVIGSKNQQGLPLARYMASQGWTVINANYRLSPHATFPEQLIDVKRAIAWTREHASEIGGDPERVLISGLSAGAHLVSLAALTADNRALQPGFEEADTSVAGCCAVYGVYDLLDRDGVWPFADMRPLLERYVIKASPEEDPERWRLACPIDQVGPHAPPFLVIHGTLDSLVPVRHARLFWEALRASGSPGSMAWAELPGAQHAFDIFPSVRCNLTNRSIYRWAEGLVRRSDAGDLA